MPSEPCYLGIDVGGTNIKSGVVTDSGRSLSRVSVPTEPARGSEIGLENLYRAASQALDAAGVSIEEIQGIGLATPGTMDIPAGMLIDPPNLPGWQNLPIRQLVAEHCGKQTVLQNDANAAAYGEYWVGAGREVNSLVLWTLGTGIGGGIVIGGQIIRGEHSHGSECGHIIIEMDGGRRCETGQYGTLEAYAGAKALVLRCREALESGRDSLIGGLLETGETLTPLLIAQAAEQGDQLADELIMETARCLGVGTTTLMHVIDPDLVLFGGSMTFGRDETELGQRFIQRIRDEVQARAFPIPAKKTTIEYASLGGDAGHIGAAGYARLKFGENP